MRRMDGDVDDPAVGSGGSSGVGANATLSPPGACGVSLSVDSTLSNGGARPKQRPALHQNGNHHPGPLSTTRRQLPAPEDSDDEPPPDGVVPPGLGGNVTSVHPRVNGTSSRRVGTLTTTSGASTDPRLLSHSASESDCTLDECIYTYKGDHVPDQNRNHSRPGAAPVRQGDQFSPDMDYLEMDFDPSAFDSSSEGDMDEPTAATGGCQMNLPPVPVLLPATSPLTLPLLETTDKVTNSAPLELTDRPRPEVSHVQLPLCDMPQLEGLFGDEAGAAKKRRSNSSVAFSADVDTVMPTATLPSEQLPLPLPVAENAKFNRLSTVERSSDSEDNADSSDGEPSLESNLDRAAVLGLGPSLAVASCPPVRRRRSQEQKVTNQRSPRNDLGGSSSSSSSTSSSSSSSSSGAGSSSHTPVSSSSSVTSPGPTLPPQTALLRHSSSDHSSVSGGRYRHCCSNDLSEPQPATCKERLQRRESSVFNIPGEPAGCGDAGAVGAAADPNLEDSHSSCPPSAEKHFLSRKGSADAALFQLGQDPSEKVMIWTEMEALTRQVTQIGPSACGATAVINVLLALGYRPDPEEAAAAVRTRARRLSAPVAEYLLSRSVAGTTHVELISGVDKLTNGQVYGRFFSMFPRRSFQLVRWLAAWMRRGAVPVATLNLQRALLPQETVPDSWHHQMVFGVGPQDVYLTNPFECTSASRLTEQLASESVLLIRRDDVTSRWRDGCHLQSLMAAPPVSAAPALSPAAMASGDPALDPRWRQMNVLGQVVNVLREAAAPVTQGVQLTRHVVIPAAYRSGVTLFLPRASQHYRRLVDEPELPLLEDC